MAYRILGNKCQWNFVRNSRLSNSTCTVHGYAITSHKSRECNHLSMPHFNGSLVVIGWLITPLTLIDVNTHSSLEFMFNLNIEERIYPILSCGCNYTKTVVCNYSSIAKVPFWFKSLTKSVGVYRNNTTETYRPISTEIESIVMYLGLFY